MLFTKVNNFETNAGDQYQRKKAKKVKSKSGSNPRDSSSQSGRGT